MKDHVVVTLVPPGDAIERLHDEAELWVWGGEGAVPRSVLLNEIPTASGLYCTLTEQIDEELLDAAPHLRVVSTMSVGADHIDRSACRDRGIAVGHTPDVLTETTADTAFALLLAAARRLSEGIDYVRDGEWQRWEPELLFGMDVHGTVIGIIGMGRIGQAVARRAKGFGMSIVYSGHRQIDAADELGARRVPLDTLLGSSDHVVVATPLTPQTHHLIDAGALAKMKPTATLVNISRGPTVDHTALAEALDAGWIAAAGLDVTEPEPIPPDHPLVTMPNCTIIPHLGSSTLRTRIAMADLAAENLIAGLRGKTLPAPLALS